MQRYLQAISEERWDEALALLDPGRFSSCHPLDLAQSTPSDPFTAFLGVSGGRDEMSAGEDFDLPESEGSVTRVGVRLRFGDQGLIGSSWELSEVFSLVRSEGVWVISGDPWPYFAWSCEELR